MRLSGTLLSAAAPGICLALLATGCGGGDAGSGTGSSADRSAEIEAALEEGGELTVWTWSTKFEDAVAAFEEEHPGVDVEIVNAGQSADQYTALQNAISSGENIPDVAMIEYFALPQLALSEQLVSVDEWGLGGLEDRFTESSWRQMTYGGTAYGLPNNTAQAAEKIKEELPGSRIASIDPGDAGGLDSLIWQGGGRPFQHEGESVTVDFTGEDTRKVNDYWSDLIGRDLVAAEPGWTDEWWRSLGDGSLATWTTGAWALGNISSTLTDNAGDFRVAPAPVWDAEDPQNAENGGSGFSAVKGSDNPALAMGFLEWFSLNEASVSAQIDAGSFPAQSAPLEDPEWLSKEFAYFGGQQANKVLADASGQVAQGWQYLPYQVYANSVFGDSVGSEISEGGAVQDGAEKWGEQLRSYGEDQGFDVG
ncbi:ABC transporter substrate-binding protein [Streptomonospora algeriensis]|uniref:ABC transporter substrate-binding protein n=1 Tax=Streptomonospora algeriensis TaxID=995084 RepID=A0ABW3BF10_9ACTN